MVISINFLPFILVFLRVALPILYKLFVGFLYIVSLDWRSVGHYSRSYSLLKMFSDKTCILFSQFFQSGHTSDKFYIFSWLAKLCNFLNSNNLNFHDWNIITDTCEVREITGMVTYNRRRRTATLIFSVIDDTATTECKLDNGPFENCKLWCVA